jgi:murein DD-endopeptidase MepM/ murein hydrolase activator NlpD
VSVDHPGGLRTTYEPVVPAVSRGDPVAAGDVLGRLGGVGSHCVTTACLHWGLRRGGTYLDPLSLLPTGVRLLPVWSDPVPAAPPPVPATLDPATLDPAPVASRGAGARPGGVAVAAGAVLAGAAAALRSRLRVPRSARRAPVTR